MVNIDGMSVLDLEYIILFKIKAWVDLKKRKDKGEDVDSKHIRKHKNDIFKLVVNMEGEQDITVSNEIKNDIKHFINIVISEPISLKNLGIRSTTLAELLEEIAKCYGVDA